MAYLKVDSPILAALATGAYLAAFYITNNVTMLPASSMLVVAIGLMAPIVLVTGLLSWLMVKIWLERYVRMAAIFVCTVYLLVVLRAPILEIDLIHKSLSMLGPNASVLAILAYLLLVLLIACFFAFLFQRYVRIYSIALSVMLIAAILPAAQAFVTDLVQDDSPGASASGGDISTVSLAQKPNIYFILADSYGSFAHLDDIGIPTNEFRNWLTGNGFSIYADAYSNYQATTAAMPAMLNMRHHYYDSSKKFSEVSRSMRVVAGGNNALVHLLRKNGYEIQYIHQGEYLLLHGCFADYCFPETSLAGAKTVLGLALPGFLRSETPWSTQSLESVAQQVLNLIGASDYPRFQYIHLYKPGHADNSKIGTCQEQQQLEQYALNIDQANRFLKELIAAITQRDTNALVVLAGDHGPMLANQCSLNDDVAGLSEYRDRAGVLLAVRWPENWESAPAYPIKTTVNLFRYIIAALTDDEGRVLATLEPEDVYVYGRQGAVKILQDGSPLNKPEAAAQK